MGVITYGASLQNEFKAWPPLVRIGAGFDLVTADQWFDAVGTPTTQATAVPAAGESSLDEKFLEVIKCVTDANDEGWSQRYTYAAEKRIKLGKHISAAIWLGTTGGGSAGLTVRLVNSDASDTAGVAVLHDGDFSLYVVEDHTCAGTYVELVVTKDSSGTFYAGGSITVMVGADAIELPPRKTVYRSLSSDVLLEDLNGSGAKARGNVDATSISSALAVMLCVQAVTADNDSTDEWGYHVYPNHWGAGAGQEGERRVWGRVGDSGDNSPFDTYFEVLCDDQQIIETELTLFSGTAIDTARLYLNGYREWE